MPKGRTIESKPGTPIALPPVTRILRNRRIISTDDENLRPGTPADLQESNMIGTAPDVNNTPSKTPRRSTRRTSISEELRTPVKNISSPLRRSTRSSSILSEDRGPSTPNRKSKQKPIATSPILEVTVELSEIITRRVTRNNTKSSPNSSKTSPILSISSEEQLNLTNESETMASATIKNYDHDENKADHDNDQKLNLSGQPKKADKENSVLNQSKSKNTSSQSKSLEFSPENTVENSRKHESKNIDLSTPGRNNDKKYNQNLFAEDENAALDKSVNNKAVLLSEEIQNKENPAEEPSTSKDESINLEADRSKKCKSVVFDEQSSILSEGSKLRYPKTPISKNKSYSEVFVHSKSATSFSTPSETNEIENSKENEKTLSITKQLKLFLNENIDVNTPDKKPLTETILSSSTPITFGSGIDMKEKLNREKNSSKTNFASRSNLSYHVVMTEDNAVSGSEDIFKKSWSQPVIGSAMENGKESFIDGFSLSNQRKYNKSIEANEDERGNLEKLRVEDSSLSEKKETEENKNEFIDDEAKEVDNSEDDSITSEELAYIKSNEIPEYGESIGSKDSERLSENDNYENDSFIASSDENAEGKEVVFISDSISEEDIMINYSETSEEKNENPSMKQKKKSIINVKSGDSISKRRSMKRDQSNNSIKETEINEINKQDLQNNGKDEANVKPEISLGNNRDHKRNDVSTSSLGANQEKQLKGNEQNIDKINSPPPLIHQNDSLTKTPDTQGCKYSLQKSFDSQNENKKQEESNFNKSISNLKNDNLTHDNDAAIRTPKKCNKSKNENKTPNTTSAYDQSNTFNLSNIFREEEKDQFAESEKDDKGNNTELVDPLSNESVTFTPKSISNSSKNLNTEKVSSAKKRKRSSLSQNQKQNDLNSEGSYKCAINFENESMEILTYAQNDERSNSSDNGHMIARWEQIHFDASAVTEQKGNKIDANTVKKNSPDQSLLERMQSSNGNEIVDKENSEISIHEKETEKNICIYEDKIVPNDKKRKSVSEEINSKIAIVEDKNKENDETGNGFNNNDEPLQEFEQKKKKPSKDIPIQPTLILGRCDRFLEELNKKKKGEKMEKKKEIKRNDKSKKRLKQNDDILHKENDNFNSEYKDNQLSQAFNHAQKLVKEKPKLLKCEGQKEESESSGNLQFNSGSGIVKELKNKTLDGETKKKNLAQHDPNELPLKRNKTVKWSDNDCDIGKHNSNGNLLLQKSIDKYKMGAEKSVKKINKTEKVQDEESNIFIKNEYNKSKSHSEKKRKMKHGKKSSSIELSETTAENANSIKKNFAIITHRSGLWIEEDVKNPKKDDTVKNCKKNRKLLTFPWGKVLEEPLTPAKRVINNFEESEITPLPKKVRKDFLPKKSKILSIINTPSGKFYEESLTQKRKTFADMFEETELTPVPKKIINKTGNVDKSLFKSQIENPLFHNKNKHTKLITTMLEPPVLSNPTLLKKDKKSKDRNYVLKEPTSVLPKPKWLSSSSNKVYDGVDFEEVDENYLTFEMKKRMKNYFQVKSVSESTGCMDFSVKPLKAKKKIKRIGAADNLQKEMWTTNEAALKFKRDAIYNNPKIKREESKELLRTKEKKKISKMY